MSQALVKVLDKEYVVNKAAASIIGVISFVALTAAGAYIRIPLPFTPVPITLQTFFVILAGAMLGKKLGLISQFSYLLVGIFGLPVFTGGLYGFARLMGPTGGYLLGFILAAYVVGTLLGNEQEHCFVKIVGSMFLGLLVLFATGTIWLSVLLHISLAQAFMLGVLPFIAGDVVKLMAAATIYQGIQKQSRAIFTN